MTLHTELQGCGNRAMSPLELAIVSSIKNNHALFLSLINCLPHFNIKEIECAFIRLFSLGIFYNFL
jgi:hypothetical protein